MPEVLRGDLASVHLSSILQLAEAERLSGALKLAEGCGVTFSEGEVTAAEAGGLQGFPALVTLFFLGRGTFVFDRREPAGGAVLAPLLRIILEGTRIVDEWTRLGPMKLGWSGAPSTLHAPLTPLGPLLDGQISLHRAALGLGLAPALLVDPILTLFEDGRLIERGAPDAPEPWPEPDALNLAAPAVEERAAPPSPTGPGSTAEADFDALLDQGRRSLRSGDHDEAERCLLRALELRPDDPIATQNLRHVRRVKAHRGLSPPLSWQRAR